VPVTLDAPALNLAFGTADCVEPRPGITPPFPDLAAAARGIGHTLLLLDPDGPVRRAPPLVDVAGRVIPSVALAASMARQGLTAAEVAVEGHTLVAGDIRVPLLAEVIPDYERRGLVGCRALVPWRGPAQGASGQRTFTSVSFYSLFRSQQEIIEGQAPEIDPATFRNKIVLVGATAQGLNEAFTTPFREGKISGPEVHANMIDGFLSHRSIAPVAPSLAVMLTVGAAVAVAFVGFLAPHAWVTAAGAAAAGASLAGLSVWLFAGGLWIPVTVPGLAIVFALVGDLAWKYVVEGREKRQVKKLFSRYVAKDVYEQLLADPSLAALGGGGGSHGYWRRRNHRLAVYRRRFERGVVGD